MSEQTVVERVKSLSRAELGSRYFARSKPVIVTEAVEGWPASRKWSLDYFEQRFGDRAVGHGDERTNLGESVRKIRASATGGPKAPYLHQIPIPTQLPELLEDVAPLLAYVERDRMQSRLMPRSFRFLDGNLELFIGGPGAGFGLLHYDIYHLHSFTVQLVGHKDFRLFAPADTHHLYANPEHPHTSQLPDAFAVDVTRFPEFAKATPIDVTLGPRETLCVPSGWWHTTKMTEVAISVAYNTLDAHNWPGFVGDYRRGVGQRMGVRGWLRTGYLRGIGGLFLARGM